MDNAKRSLTSEGYRLKHELGQLKNTGRVLDKDIIFGAEIVIYKKREGGPQSYRKMRMEGMLVQCNQL